MEKISKFVFKASNHALFKVAAFMLVLGSAAVARCLYPMWHNEPEMPQSMLDELK